MEKPIFPKDERQGNEGVVSIVDNDFILNFLNEYDHHPKNSFYANPNLAASFNNFYEAFPMEQPNFLMGNYMRPMDIMNENERMQAAQCKMEEQNLRGGLNNLGQDQKNNRTKKKSNYKKKSPNNCKNLRKTNEPTPQVNLLQLKEINQNEELFNYRNNIKNTYINKISNLITNNIEENHFLTKKSNMVKSENEDDSDMDQQHKIPDSANQLSKRPHKFDNSKRNDELDRLNKKLEKNRESARNSRKRKKIYIEILENKVAELTHQLESANKSLDFNQEQLKKISSHSKFLNNLIQIKQQIYNKLEKLTLQPSGQVENEINLLIDSMRLRLGATGKERVTAINSLFKQITQILLPGYIRFLFGISAEGIEKVEENSAIKIERKGSNVSENSFNFETCLNAEFISEEQQRRLFAELNLVDSQKKAFKKFKKKINLEKNKLKNFLESILTIKQSIQKQTMNIDNSIDELRNSFTPLQITKFLLFVEKEKKMVKMDLARLMVEPENSFYDDDSDSNASNFSDLHKEDTIEIENEQGYKQENVEGQEPIQKNIEGLKENNSKRKKVHLNEELISPL